MQTVQVEYLDAEEEAAKNAAVSVANEVKERERIAAANRSAGHRKPEIGDRVFVTTARGLPRRGRAGILFVQEKRTELVVVENIDAPGDLSAGTIAVTIASAEAILHDGNLNVNARSSTDAEAADLRGKVADRDAEIAKLRAELTRAQRDARMAAPPDPSGGPARLRAARAAGKTSDPEGFGGKD